MFKEQKITYKKICCKIGVKITVFYIWHIVYFVSTAYNYRNVLIFKQILNLSHYRQQKTIKFITFNETRC